MRIIYILLFSITMMTMGCKTTQKGNAASIKEDIKEEVVEVSEDSLQPKFDEYGFPILLEYTPTMIDLGKVNHGEKRELEFEYKNISNEVVEIEIVSACSCTETDFTVKKMNPGEGGKILLVFDSTSKKKSETIDVEVILKNTEPKNGYPIVNTVQFKYDLVLNDK